MSWNDLRKGRHSTIGQEYLVTLVTHRRQPFFSDFGNARILVGEMRRLQEEGRVCWLCWVIMPDHFHALARLDGGKLWAAVRQLKGASARRINQGHDRRGSVWQPGYHDHALRREEDRLQVARYIVANPLRAGLVKRLGDYPHWDSV